MDPGSWRTSLTLHKGVEAELGVFRGGGPLIGAKNRTPYILCFPSYFITYEACENF
jgi:hypothetical protein